MKIHIYIQDEDVSEWITSLSTSISFEENKLIGNTPSMEMSLKADNHDGKFNTLLDFPFLMKDELGHLLGVFDVYEKPEKMTQILNLTLYDRMVLANEEYVTKLDYPVKVEDILNEIANKLNITIDASLLPEQIQKKQINFYDSRETMRNHLGWIAEAGGCNVMADEFGNYRFIPLSIDVDHTLLSDDVEQFETIETYTLSGVRIDNGITPILSGNEDGNVYLLNEENPYISSQEDVDLIYEKLSGLHFTSCREIRSCAIDGLKCGEMVNHDKYFTFLALNIVTNYLNAAYDIQLISGEMSTKNVTKTHLVNSTQNTIKRIQSILDQNEGNLKIIADKVNEYEKKIGDLSFDADGFKTEIINAVTEKETTVSVSEIKSEYGISENEETSPSEWLESIPETIELDKYLWKRDVITYSSGLIMYENTHWICKQTNDETISSITTYYVINDSENDKPNAGWQETMPSFISSYFLWQKVRVTYTNRTYTEKEPYCIPLKKKLEDIDKQMNNLINQISTSITQLSNGIQLTKTTIDELDRSIEEWARFDGAELELGMSSSLFKAKLSNVELSFWQGDTKVAYLSNNELHLASTVITKSSGVGNLRLVNEDDAGFSFMKVN